jgi:hypothetical protein
MQLSGNMLNEKSLVEGKPQYRETFKGLYQYVKYNNEVYSQLLTKNTRSLEEEINDTVNNITVNEITVTDPIDVDMGGTGLATIADGAVMLGSGTSAVTPLAVTTSGSILIGDGTTDPTTYNAFSSSTGTLNVGAGGTGQTTVTDFKNVLDDETWTFANNVTATGRVIVDDATEATSTTDGSLQTDGGLSVVKDAIFGNDVKLLTDASVFSMGVGSDFTITHDNTTGGTLAASPITINSTGDMTLDSTTDIILDAAGDQVYFKDNGTTRIVVNLDGSPEMDVTGNFTIDGSATITLDSVGNFIVKTNASQRFKVDTGGHAYFHNFEGTFTGGEALFNDYKINNLADNYHFVTAFDDLKQNYVLLAEDTESAAGTFNPGYGS